MRPIDYLSSLLIVTLLTIAGPTFAHAEEFDTLILEDEGSELLIIDEPTTFTTEDSPEQTDMLIMDDENDDELLIDGDQEDTELLAMSQTEQNKTGLQTKPFTAKLDQLWVEYGQFTKQSASKNHQGYLNAIATAEWSPSSRWEFHASIRADGYSESGSNNWDDLRLDYDEIYARFRTDNSIFTLGTQKVLWGRIDEFPPTDRLSTQDFRRFVLDDLTDRRLASPAIRMEHFFDNNKIDLVFYPHFREAQLADKDSIWYPVNKGTGEILGLDTTDTAEAIVKNTPVAEHAPNTDGGFGLRYSSLSSGFDYAITVQKGPQTVPYFSYNPDENIIEGRYPRTWIVGGDFGTEALGGTLKFEASWLSDTPVTRKDGRYTTVESINWGVALELFPGDGDTRLNLQLTSVKLFGAPSVMDRDELYSFNGSVEAPFAENRWRAKMRFNTGLDEKDIYLNPEIAFTGWEAQELYLEFHFFDGDKGTPGGFYEDNDILTLGWRMNF